MITGTIIGEISTLMIDVRAGKLARLRPNAASVQSVVAMTVVKGGDDDAGLEGQHPAFVGEEILIPAQRQARHRIAEIRFGVERERHDHEDRRDQEQQHGGA
jgi:hypothetical protein